MRTAAVILDDFLSVDRWNYITKTVSQSNFLITDEFMEWRDSFYEEVMSFMIERMKQLDIWQDHWDSTIPLWSFINTLPPGIDRESSGNNGGYHSEFGGFVYYIHPTWNTSWGGHLKFKNCDVEKIEPKPNRFVWINPGVFHGIEVVNETAENNRITIVGWPEGCIETSHASQIINILIEENIE